MPTDEEVEAGAAGMYGKNWNSEDSQKRPGPKMKDIWRSYARDCLTGAEEVKVTDSIGTALDDLKIPDFGTVTEIIDNTKVHTRAIAPNLTIHKLVEIYELASKHVIRAQGNPHTWPVTRGVTAVADAIIRAIYK